MLQSEEADIIRSALTCLTKMLEKDGNGIETIRQSIRDCNGFEKIHRLQIHEDAGIQCLTEALLPYFDVKPPRRPNVEVNSDRPTR